MGRKRILTLLLILVVVIIIATGSWIAGSSIQSPAEVAARTAPPTPSPILVPVEERVLTSQIVTRGTARFGLPQAISLAPSSLKAGPGVITTLPQRNDLDMKSGGRACPHVLKQTPEYDVRGSPPRGYVNHVEESVTVR